MTILGHLLAFIVAIGILVAVHEFGHFWVARRARNQGAALLDRFRQAALAPPRVPMAQSM